MILETGEFVTCIAEYVNDCERSSQINKITKGYGFKERQKVYFFEAEVFE